MARFLVRRLIQAIPTLIGISIIAFAIMTLAPGGPTTALASDPKFDGTTTRSNRNSVRRKRPHPYPIYAVVNRRCAD